MGKLEKIPAWQLTKSQKQKKRWSKKQGIRAEKFISRHWWISVIWRIRNRSFNIKSTKAESYSKVKLWKMIQDDTQYLLNKDHQHHRWQSQKSWTLFQDHWDAQDKQQMRCPLRPRSKWKVHRRCWKFQSQNVQTFGYVYQNTSGQNHGPVWMTQSFVSNGICTVIFWQDYHGNSNLRKFCWNTVGKVPNWECLFVNREKGLFLSVYVDDIILAGKRQKLSSDMENSYERRWFGKTNISPWPCLFGLHSMRMRNKQGYCGLLQKYVRSKDFCWSCRQNCQKEKPRRNLMPKRSSHGPTTWTVMQKKLRGKILRTCE